MTRHAGWSEIDGRTRTDRYLKSWRAPAACTLFSSRWHGRTRMKERSILNEQRQQIRCNKNQTAKCTGGDAAGAHAADQRDGPRLPHRPLPRIPLSAPSKQCDDDGQKNKKQLRRGTNLCGLLDKISKLQRRIIGSFTIITREEEYD